MPPRVCYHVQFADLTSFTCIYTILLFIFSPHSTPLHFTTKSNTNISNFTSNNRFGYSEDPKLRMECLEIDSSLSSSCKPCNPESESSSSSSSSLADQPLMVISSSSHKRRAGRKKFKETRHPVFRGVRQRRGNKWVSEIREPCKKTRIWLGTFLSPEMAARAYDVAVLALRGKSAALNFPDSASVLPRAKSCSPKDIQFAAFAAAEAFKPSTNIGHQPVGRSSPSQVSDENDEGKRGLDRSWDFEITDGNEKYEFMDEEALFNMPGLLDSMAEGLLLTSPALQTHVYDWDDDILSTVNIDLWGHY
ncbi:hypothetical protein HRI_002893600 [Hibiscus trionum]|uniref:AP2/ERF domain-containing protein n=1 Tax=Hibiscus trionum TaxID=183268 RepID=A0A9W7ID79_HIBTR|nr:hypothetical protein HRI_002893600 [Hibiscus trionum]